MMMKKKKSSRATKKKITSRRQSLSVSRRIHRVPGMDLVLTTRYLPLGFHTSMEMGFAMAALPRSSRSVRKSDLAYSAALMNDGLAWPDWALPYRMNERKVQVGQPENFPPLLAWPRLMDGLWIRKQRPSRAPYRSSASKLTT
jgi:hypothetical protein